MRVLLLVTISNATQTQEVYIVSFLLLAFTDKLSTFSSGESMTNKAVLSLLLMASPVKCLVSSSIEAGGYQFVPISSSLIGVVLGPCSRTRSLTGNWRSGNMKRDRSWSIGISSGSSLISAA